MKHTNMLNSLNTHTCMRNGTWIHAYAHQIMLHRVPSTLCPLPLVAGTTLYFLFLHLYCFYTQTDFTAIDWAMVQSIQPGIKLARSNFYFQLANR